MVLTINFLNYSTVLISLIYFIIVLGILVFVHEFGHFIFAKKLGVGVITFSLGFGPKLIGKKIGETQYQISAVPLGGYVKLIGEDRTEQLKEEDLKRSFSAQPIWKRVLIICAGPFFNIFLTIVLLCITFLAYGIPQDLLPLPAKIGDLSQGLPAEKAGLKRGDIVISINGTPVSNWEDLSKIIRTSDGKELTLKVNRDEKTLDVTITPQVSKEETKSGGTPVYIIGIKAPSEDFKFVYKKAEVGEALSQGVVQTWMYIKFTAIVVSKMVTGEISRKEIGGPIEIARQAGKQGSKGLSYLLGLMALLGVNLGLLNLCPIPILDGGHLLFLCIEAVLGKPVSLKKMEIAQQIGLFLIILLMLFAFYNDILRLLPGGFKF
jgi:regulator of sigma E protease